MASFINRQAQILEDIWKHKPSKWISDIYRFFLVLLLTPTASESVLRYIMQYLWCIQMFKLVHIMNRFSRWRFKMLGSLLCLTLFAILPASGIRTARYTITKDVEMAQPNQTNPFYSKGKLMLTQTSSFSCISGHFICYHISYTATDF